MPGNPANPRTGLQHTAHEIFIDPVLHGLRQRGGAAAAQCGARDDLGLPAHSFAAGWFQLPPSADLLGLWRRGDRALRALGRRMDDPGAAVALSALGHLRDRQCSVDKARWRAMVSALAVRTLARRQRALKTGPAAALSDELRIAAEPGLSDGIGSMSSREDVNNAVENRPRRSRSPADRFIGSAGLGLPYHRGGLLFRSA